MSKFFEERDAAIKDMIYLGYARPLWMWVHKYTFPIEFARDIPGNYDVNFELWCYAFCTSQVWLSELEKERCYEGMKKLYDKIENEPEV